MKCIKCCNEKSENEFEMRADTKKRRNTCKECRSVYVKIYKDKRKNGIINKKENIMLKSFKLVNKYKKKNVLSIN